MEIVLKNLYRDTFDYSKIKKPLCVQDKYDELKVDEPEYSGVVNFHSVVTAPDETIPCVSNMNEIAMRFGIVIDIVCPSCYNGIPKKSKKIDVRYLPKMHNITYEVVKRKVSECAETDYICELATFFQYSRSNGRRIFEFSQLRDNLGYFPSHMVARVPYMINSFNNALLEIQKTYYDIVKEKYEQSNHS